MAQEPVGRPFDEADLRHQLRSHPAHLGHLFRRHAATPVGGLAVQRSTHGQRAVWSGSSWANTCRRTCGVKPARTLPATAVPGLVVADQQRIHLVTAGTIPIDDELLLFVKLQLLPGGAPLAGDGGESLRLATMPSRLRERTAVITSMA
jgi:hypothetical protein